MITIKNQFFKIMLYFELKFKFKKILAKTLIDFEIMSVV